MALCIVHVGGKEFAYRPNSLACFENMSRT